VREILFPPIKPPIAGGRFYLEALPEGLSLKTESELDRQKNTFAICDTMIALRQTVVACR